MSPENPHHCLKAENCLDANRREIMQCVSGRAAEKYYASTPLLPAERLCIAGMEKHQESRSRSNLTDKLSTVSFDIDRLLALPDLSFHEDGSFAKNNLSTKQNLVVQIMGTLLTVPDIRTVRQTGAFRNAGQLKLLGIFMPAFISRSHERLPESGLIQQIHGGLCQHIEILNASMHSPNYSHQLKKEIAAHKAECDVMALQTRIGKCPFPSVAREEASHVKSQNNHDHYRLMGDRKKAVQVKTSANGAGYRDVVVISHYDILRSFRRDPITDVVQWVPAKGHQDFEWPNPYRYEQTLTGEAPDPLAELLVEELRCGNRLSADKKNVLSLASAYVESRLR